LTRHAWTVEDGGRGRLDRYIADRLTLSRNRVTQLLIEGRITVDGERPRKSHAVEAGQDIVVDVPAPEPIEAQAEAIEVPIVFQDGDLVVVDKPAGLVVHPAPGHRTGTLVNALLHQVGDLSGIGGALRPGIVHRLDKDTSGLLVVAKSDRAHQGLSRSLKAREIVRIYLTALWGHLADDTVQVDAPIGRDPRHRKRMAVREDGRKARSVFHALERWPAAQFCRVQLHSGRTHQIRVHGLHIGHPVVGDPLYASGRERGFSGPSRPWAAELARRATRQFLHAAELHFRHPVSGEDLAFTSDLPAELEGIRNWALGRAL